ncbi:TerB family tellurite resistance protein [Aurantimonas sp. HBX-1]|uniref:tellurite resistance TerB family protein n=1 Tax=Aurantimonas sp. HBX-1 TaxID=2906072 RepID=UPI001F2775D0|nr:TerB family tellurite resistance protein [Aurantimonas sp. HBX-1]UIJ71961.1 TerB family tellurite resistance protein [Aurantimonas sp. HBX-1]
MFDAFRDFIRSIGTDDSADDRGADDVRVAAAALLYHVIDADGIVTPAERQRLHDVLAEEFGLSAGETRRIAEAGEAADAEAVDLYRFTSVLKAELDEERRIRFIELLWEVTYVDGSVHELEDNVIWRIAELLAVSTRDRMLMKREAANRSGNPD